ncbi:MAG: aryl-sulfate sulfotransferase [Erysipelotrichaceae bacterium]
MKNKKIWFIAILSIACLVLVGFNIVNKDGQTLIEPQTSLREEQAAVNLSIQNLSGYTIEAPYIEVNPYGTAPLTALIVFETEGEVAVEICIKAKEDGMDIVHTFEASTLHEIPVYGLYADYLNEVVLTVNGEEYLFNIQTEALPDDFVYPTVVELQDGYQFDELYFVSPANVGYFAGYDQSGEVRWYYTKQAIWAIKRLENNHILTSTERLVSTPYYSTGLYEIDLMGKVYVEYSLPGGYHHDYYEMENGNLIVASDDFSGGTVEDVIVELDRTTGEVVYQIDLKDILPMDEGKSNMWIESDWFHNNSVDYDEETDQLLLSGRHQDAVISIDYSEGTLNWIIGDSTGWSDEMQSYFFTPTNDVDWQWAQHAAMFMPDNQVFIFDNGNNRSKIAEEYLEAEDNYSRGVIYQYDTDSMEITEMYQFGKELGASFYSPYISDVDYLGENHYIVHSGGIGTLDGEAVNVPAAFVDGAELNSITVEIKDDEVLFEMQLPSHYYQVEKLSLYTDGDNYNSSDSVGLGDLGTTAIKETTYGLTTSDIEVDARFELEIVKEYDRLTLTGVYHKTDEVDIILRQGITQLVYPIMITDNQYTAMCVYIPSDEVGEDELMISKYINEPGLSGVYNIYLRVNGVVYNTYQQVDFD